MKMKKTTRRGGKPRRKGNRGKNAKNKRVNAYEL